MNKYCREILGEIKPEKLYQASLSSFVQEYQALFGKYEKVYLLGMGKAASLEVSCIIETLPREIEDFFIITKTGHSIEKFQTKSFESSHPYIDEKSFEAAELALDFVSKVGSKDLLICAISGGTSALIEKFAPEQKEKLKVKFNKLIDEGVNIDELNTLRKAFSLVKNGELIRECQGSVLTFITSDIPDNNPYLVGSSPSMHENIRDEYILGLLDQFQFDVMPLLKERYPFRGSDKYEVLVKYQSLIPICQSVFKTPLKINPMAYNHVLEQVMEDYLAELDLRYLNLSFGELNIKVSGAGLGGRNTHFVLAMAQKIFGENHFDLSQEQLEEIIIFSLGTDGTDGPTDAAGAWMNYQHFTQLDPGAYLEAFDSYHYFQKIDTLIKTGPTGTNLMDIRGVGSLGSR